MLILDSTAKILRVTLNAAHTTTPLRCVCSYRDTTATTFVPGNVLINTNGTTPIQLAPAPAASTQRVIDFFSIFNSDTATKNVTVSVYDGATDFVLATIALGVGERIEYSDGNGISCYNSAGALKTILTGTANPVGSGWSTNVLAADVINAAANVIADVTGLSFPVVNGTRYNFRFVINFTCNATTTGSRWAINGPTNSELRYKSEYSLTSTTNTVNEGVTAYDSPAGVSATSAAITGNQAIIEGFILPTADGNVIARFASEVAVANGIVAKRGSYVTFIAV